MANNLAATNSRKKSLKGPNFRVDHLVLLSYHLVSVDLSVEVFLQPLKTLGTNLLFFGKFLGQSAKSRPIFLVTIYEIFSCKTVRSTIIAICKGSDQSDLKYVKDKNEYDNRFES